MAWARGTFVLFLTISALLVVALLVTGLFVELNARRTGREIAAWQLIETARSGNAGVVSALEYLNSVSSLAIPNPRRGGIPLGPRAANKGDPLPKKWMLVRNLGPFKDRSALDGIELSGAEGDLVFLEGIDLRNATLNDAVLTHVDFGQAKLSSAQLAWGNFSNSDFTGAHLASAAFLGSNLSSAILVSADLTDADLFAADLTGASLRKANLSNANLGSAKLARADLSAADLTGAYLGASDLSEANLQGAILAGADFSGAVLVSVKGLSQAQVTAACTSAQTTLPPGIMAPEPCRRDELGRIRFDSAGLPLRSQ